VHAVAAKLNRDFEGLVHFETVLWEERLYKADRSFQAQIPEPVACDIVVSIFWTRLGTELPADFQRMPDGDPYPSGTAYELLTALAASREKGAPEVYVFRKTADLAMPTSDPHRRRQAHAQIEALEAFWNKWFKSEQGHFKAAFHSFQDADEFESLIEQMLRQWYESHGLLDRRLPLSWPPVKGAPFRGLAPFEAEHAAIFYGRDRVIDEARRRLVAAADESLPFLLIVGPSGVGKSSLVRAGLIPRLTTPGVVLGVDFWRVALMKAGESVGGPLLSLATALFAALPELREGHFPKAAVLSQHLQRGGPAAVKPVVRAIERAVERAQRDRHMDRPLRPALLMLVDQLEALFAQAVSDAERVAFVEGIKELVATGLVWCVATLRADVYELMLGLPALKALKEAGASLDLSPPAPAELADIVRKPAAAAGLAFEQDAGHGILDDRLLADARTADILPLLQFTLHQLYERRVDTDGRTLLTHAAYDALGGLNGAIAAEADRAVSELPHRTLAALPRLLRRLAEPAQDGKSLTLREAARADFAADSPESELLAALLRARILVVGKESAGQPMLRLAHDAVLTSWPKAEEAVQSSHKFYQVRSEVERAHLRWRENGEQPDRLIQPGILLVEAEQLASDFWRELPRDLLRFVNLSSDWARRRRRWLLYLAVSFALIVEVIVYVPAVANFRLTWLSSKLDAASTAALALDAAPAVSDNPSRHILSRHILYGIGARVIAMKEAQRRRLLFAVTDVPFEALQETEIRDVRPLRNITETFRTMWLAEGSDFLRIVGPAPMRGREAFVEIAIPEGLLRNALWIYSLSYILLATALASVSAALLYSALFYIVMRNRNRTNLALKSYPPPT
jgi:hypothetical protein